MSATTQHSHASKDETKPLLSLTDIDVILEKRVILKNISLTLRRGEIVTVIGPNGSGKTTLIKVALGLLKPSSGLVDSVPMMTIGYVPQIFEPDDSIPITVNRFLRLKRALDKEHFERICTQVGIESILNSQLFHISGGEIRRVLIARALLLKPDLLILDEPTAGVDDSGQNEMYSLIKSIRERYNCGVLLVSHDLHIVMASTDRVICLNKHMCCTGTPEHVSRHPEFVALFGSHHADNMAVYRHDHDHTHQLDGSIDRNPPKKITESIDD